MTNSSAPSGAPQQPHNTPQPGQIPPGAAWPGQPGYDPKAAAKAAKAYAKAQRPWFKKKRFIVPLALVALAVVTSVASGEDAPTGPTVASADASGEAAAVAGDASPAGKASKKSSSDTKSSSDKAAEPGSKDNPAKVGDTVTLEGTRYTVEKVRTPRVLGRSMLEEKAAGRFVVVRLTLENTKDDTRTFSDSAATLVAANGKTYSTTSDAIFLVEDNLLLEEMQPDLPTTGTIVFDVPAKAMSGMLLEVSDLFGRGEAYVDLGL